jgi:hypothetical protein
VIKTETELTNQSIILSARGESMADTKVQIHKKKFDLLMKNSRFIVINEDESRQVIKIKRER